MKTELISWIMVGAVAGIPGLYLLGKKAKGWYTLALNLVIAVFSTMLVLPSLAGEEQLIDLAYLNVLGPFRFQIDTLSAFFVLLINVVVVCASLYSIGYLKVHHHSYSPDVHYTAFVFLHQSMILVCLVQQLFVFFVIWEIMSLSSFLLVLYESDQRGNLKAAMNYFVQMHIGVVFLMIAFIWLNFRTGGENFASLHIFFEVNSNWALFGLFFLGFGMKAGFLPLHTWLPYAHPVAPSHISALMSGIMIKMGVYGILRVLTFVRTDLLEIGLFILFVGLFTGLYGILQSTVQKDLKKMLAYSTIENVGIIGIGIGISVIGRALNNPLIAQLGITGALLHVLNHALMKPLLFFGAGSVYLATHTKRMDFLGGLIKKMPVTSILFVCGAMAICGLPPFNGFVSEFLIYSGMLGLLQADFSMDVIELVALLVLVLIGGLSIFSFTRTTGMVFLGSGRTKEAGQAEEVSVLMLAPQFLLLILMLLIGVFPEVFVKKISLIAQPLLTNMNMEDFSTFSIADIGLASLTFLVLVAGMYAVRLFVVRKNGERYGPTWGCGYTGNPSRMQYTASSFGDNMWQLFSPLLGRKVQYKEIEETDIFPENRTFQSRHDDVLEEKVLKPPLEFLSNYMLKFARIQDGNTQHYIMYVLVFIVVLTVLTLFNSI